MGNPRDGKIPSPQYISTSVYRPDGATLALSSNKLVTLYDAKTGAPRVVLRGRVPFWPFS